MTADTPTSPLRTLIVDDEPLAVERLQVLCAREPHVQLVGTASDGEAALRVIAELQPDLVFLDIAMPKVDGMDVARVLSATGNPPAVVFVTAFNDFAVDAFDLDVVDFVTKPVAAERLSRALERAEAHRAARAEIAQAPEPATSASGYASEFWVPHRSELIRVATEDIDRVEAERDYMRLYIGQRSYLVHQTITTLEERLDPAQFLRIHRSHMVRRSFVTGLRHEGGGVWHVTLADDSSLRIGRKYLAEAKALAGR